MESCDFQRKALAMFILEGWCACYQLLPRNKIYQGILTILRWLLLHHFERADKESGRSCIYLGSWPTTVPNMISSQLFTHKVFQLIKNALSKNEFPNFRISKFLKTTKLWSLFQNVVCREKCTPSLQLSRMGIDLYKKNGREIDTCIKIGYFRVVWLA